MNEDFSEDKPAPLPELTSDFLNHKFVQHMLEEGASVRCAWDFNTALGDTIREKYESLYVKLVEVTNVLVHKGARGFFWIVASPEVASIFEVATASFWPSDNGKYGSQIPIGIPEVYELGVVARRWRVYVDPGLDHNSLLIGAGMDTSENAKCAVMRMCNFVI